MKRLITLCSGQFGDIPLEELCRSMKEIGYDTKVVSDKPKEKEKK